MSKPAFATVKSTSSQQGFPKKKIIYTRDDENVPEEFLIHRSACVTKGDRLELVDENTVYVSCKVGDGRAQILPCYSEADEVQLGDLTIPVEVKEITELKEYEAYQHLQFHHYRGKSLFGRHAPLVMCVSHPLLPDVVGYIELATPFLVSKPRHNFFNTVCKLNGISWQEWNRETSRKYISLFVRIARGVFTLNLEGQVLDKSLSNIQ